MQTQPDWSRSLQTQAAILSGWPRLEVTCADEESALSISAMLESILGALPQGEIIEPWATDGPWLIRSVLPGLTISQWRLIEEQLPREIERCLVTGVTAGRAVALDSGVRIQETIEAGGLSANIYHRDDGQLLSYDLLLAKPDGVTAVLIEHLHAQLLARFGDLPCELHPAIDKATGRAGIQISLDSSLGSDDELIIALLETLSVPVKESLSDPKLRLAPDLSVETHSLGLVAILWLVTPPFGGDVRPTRLSRGVNSWCLGADSEVLELVQLVVAGESTAALDGAVESVIEEMAGRDLPLSGGPLTWVEIDGEVVAAATWLCLADNIDSLEGLPEALITGEGVVAVAIWPEQPVFSGDVWGFSDRALAVEDGLAVVKMRDVRFERRWAPAFTVTSESDQDGEALAWATEHAVIQSVSAVTVPLPDGAKLAAIYVAYSSDNLSTFAQIVVEHGFRYAVELRVGELLLFR